MTLKKRQRKTLATQSTLVAQLDYEKGSPQHNAALKLTLGSNKKLNWKDEKGHKWSARVASRANGGSGCPHCFNESRTKQNKRQKKSVAGMYLYDFPSIVARLVDKSQANLTAGSGKKIKVICTGCPK